MDGADKLLFAASLRHATGSHSGAVLDAALNDLGWRDALAVDAHTAVSLLFELQGSANTTSSALTDVLGTALGLEIHPAGAVLLPALGSWLPPGDLVGESLQVSGLATTALTQGATALVAATKDGATVLVEVAVSDLLVRPIHGLDPSLELVEVTGQQIAVEHQSDLVPGGWSAAVALAHLALGHELVGTSRRMLELARSHALERVQFGQTISGFQAVRHRLAETLIAIETADAMLGSAWLDPTNEAASMAKSLAGRGARIAARHCQQVLAGIGFTTEHDLHLYIRRALVLDQLFGTALTLTRELGNQLLESRQLATMPPL
jgi:Acyl-CoA dehydrogenase, C-terminal domain